MTTASSVLKPSPQPKLMSPPVLGDNITFACFSRTSLTMQKHSSFYLFYLFIYFSLHYVYKNMGKLCFLLSVIQAYNRIDSDLVAHFPQAPSSLVFPSLQPPACCTGWKVGGGSVCMCRIKAGVCVSVCFHSMLDMVFNALGRTYVLDGKSRNCVNVYATQTDTNITDALVPSRTSSLYKWEPHLHFIYICTKTHPITSQM